MIIGILQARVSSTRLPGKVLKPILGKPMLALHIERLKRCTNCDALVVATSTSRDDDPLETLCSAIGIPCVRGSLDDVLDRFYQVALRYAPDHIVRLTGDCPLADPEIIDQVIDFYISGNFDYASNVLDPTFPDGLDAEVFRFSALQAAWEEARLPSQREHVTSFITDSPERFRLGSFTRSGDLSHLRWTVDEPEDFELIREIYAALYPKYRLFTTSQILEFLERNPQLCRLNAHLTRDASYYEMIATETHQSEAKQPVSTPQKSQFPVNLSRSLAMQNRARHRIPGMTQLLSKRPDQFSLGVWPGYYQRASGVEVWDLDGNRYIDMSVGGVGANVLGYADPDVDAAVKEAIALGSSCSLNVAEEVELADVLCELHPWAEKVRYARTGGEATTIAIRIARAFTGKDTIAFCGYHGWHDWYLAANLTTQDALGEHLLAGLNPRGVPKGLAGTALPFRYNCLSDLEQIVAKHGPKIAAIIMEPIRNHQPIPGFLEGVRTLSEEIGAVLVIDEISAGFRMNTGGAHLVFQLEPDIAVFAKALGNGYPMSAVIGKGHIMEAAQNTFISSTHWTERIGPTAALATIRKHRQLKVGDHLIALGNTIQAGWRTLAEKHALPIRVAGIPPLSHFSFDDPRSAALEAVFTQLMLQHGFLASASFYAMYAHKPQQINDYLQRVDDVFQMLTRALQSGTIEELLHGQPAAPGFARLT